MSKLRPTRQVVELAAAANSAILAMDPDWQVRYRLHEALFLLKQRYALPNLGEYGMKKASSNTQTVEEK